MSDTKQLAFSAAQIDAILAAAQMHSNRNLLDNPDFRAGCVVNQRGVSGAISAAGYFIDRWKLISGTVTITADGLTLNGTIRQIRENSVGQTTTASVDMHSGTAEISYNDTTKYCDIVSSGGTIARCKLELGSHQTLAHQDANGNWVLNEIPDYGEQLARCQRYHVKGSLSRVPTLIYNSGKELWLSIKLPVPMRVATPALVRITTYAWIYHQGTAYDANGAQEFLPGENVNFITTDTDCTKSGEIGVHLTLNNALQNAIDGSTGWIAFLDYEITADL